jgi:hypothetical protein
MTIASILDLYLLDAFATVSLSKGPYHLLDPLDQVLGFVVRHWLYP